MAGLKFGSLEFVVPLLLAVSAAAQQGFPPSPLGQPPFGQQQEPRPQIMPDSSTVTLKVTTQLTIESVTVTDAAGKPVHGLAQANFTVKEDGKLQRIKNFEEYGEAISSQPSAPPPVLPLHVYTNAPPPGLQSGAVNILLLDMLNTGPARQETVREKAITYLKNMPAGTEVAIFELGSELRVVQGLTADQAVLLAAMASIQPNNVINQHTDQKGIVRFADGTPRAPCDGEPARQIGDVLNRRSKATLVALDAIAAFGSGIKGRKNLLWFTYGLTQITSFSYVYNLLLTLGCHWTPTLVDYTSSLQRAYGLLSAAQVAVYPIDPRGLNTGESQAGDVGELKLGDSPIEEMPEYMEKAAFSLQEIAGNTGGKAYYDRNDLDAAIGEAIANGAHSYSLSYVPPSSKEGKYHKVEIAVDRPGLHLQYREHYTTVDPSKPLAEKKDAKNAPSPDSDFHAAVDRGMIPSTGLLFYLRLTPSSAPAKPGDPAVAGMLNSKLKGKPLVRYALIYEMPPGEVTLVDGPDGTRKGSLEFDVVAYGTVAYGEDRAKLNVVREVVNFTLKANEVEHFVKNPVVMPIQIDLPPGKVDLHAGVLDVSSQKMGTLEITETVTNK
jgi:VWFA-related protein